jgi:hypothetical protein
MALQQHGVCTEQRVVHHPDNWLKHSERTAEAHLQVRTHEITAVCICQRCDAHGGGLGDKQWQTYLGLLYFKAKCTIPDDRA